MPKNSLSNKLEQAGNLGVQRKGELMLQGKPFNLYDLIQINFGQYLEELIEELRDWEYQANKFEAQIELHKKIILYLNQLGVQEVQVKDLEKYERYYRRMLMEVEVHYAQKQPALFEAGDKKIDLELRVVQTAVPFEPDKDARAKKAEKFVSEYLRKIGGEENLSIEAAKATLPGFNEDEAINGRFYLLLMFKNVTQGKIQQAKGYIPTIEQEFKTAGGKLSREEETEFDNFVGNLHPKYSSGAYHARFSQYKIEKSQELLKALKPLP